MNHRSEAWCAASSANLVAPPPPAPCFEQIYRDHRSFVWRSARRLGVARDDLEDQCQLVFEVVHRRLPEFRGDSKLSTWLFGIVARVASDYRRSAYRQRFVLEEQPEIALPPEQGDQLERAEARALVDQLLAVLDDDKRAALVLCDLDGMEVKAVARMLGVPIQTVYSRLRLARSRLERAVRQLAALARGR